MESIQAGYQTGPPDLDPMLQASQRRRMCVAGRVSPTRYFNCSHTTRTVQGAATASCFHFHHHSSRDVHAAVQHTQRGTGECVLLSYCPRASDLFCCADQLQALRGYLALAPADEVAKRINTADTDGRTPLHWAAARGTPELFEALLSSGGEASLEAKDQSGWTPLLIASSAGNLVGVQTLLARGANPTTGNLKNITPLHYAASKGHTDLGLLLLEAGALVNARDGAKQVPMHRAASSGHDSFVRLLLSPPERKDGHAHEKTRLNPADRVGNTPLHLAMDSGHGSTAILLLQAGADRERANMDGEAPEDIEGSGGQAQLRLKQYIASVVGPRR